MKPGFPPPTTRHLPLAILSLMSFLLAACDRPPDTPVPLGLAVDGNPIPPDTLPDFTKTTGLTPAVVTFFLAWPGDPSGDNFPSESLATITAAGATPVITWEPWSPVEGPQEFRTIPAADILSGKWDAYLASFANAAAAQPGPVWIRFAHEMNTPRYHWGIADSADFGPDAPFIYRRMFQYVVEAFRRAGVTNVRWVFCPNHESIPHPDRDAATWNRASRYYPGDDYVDILGMDGYNWGDTRTAARDGWDSRWQTFREVFTPLHDELRALAPDKPLGVFETATTTQGGDKAAWIADAAGTARAWQLDLLTWFEVNKEADWRLQTGVDRSALAPLDAR